MCCLLLHQETTSTQVHIQLLSLCSSSQIYSGYLTRSSFSHNIYGPCQSLICGFDSMQYVSHSFRIRAATTAETVGLPNCLIKVLHQWKSNVYIPHLHKDTYMQRHYTQRFMVGSLYFVHIYGRRNGEAGTKITPSKIITEEGGGLQTRQRKNKI